MAQHTSRTASIISGSDYVRPADPNKHANDSSASTKCVRHRPRRVIGRETETSVVLRPRGQDAAPPLRRRHGACSVGQQQQLGDGEAEVIKVPPHRSYQLRFEDGTTRRRISRHVRFSREPPIVIRDETDEPNTSPSSSLPSQVTADSNDQQQPLPLRSTSAATRTTLWPSCVTSGQIC